jgi:hypothetical protein
MPLEMRHRHSHLLLGYWVGLHKGPLPPREGELDAEVMRALLPAICVAEMHNGGPPYYRLVGREIERRMGEDVTGAPISAFWARGDCAEIQDYFFRSSRSQRPFFYTSVGRDDAGGWHLFETLWVPIQMDDPQVACFVGVSEPLSEGSGPPGRLIGREALAGIWLLDGQHPSATEATTCGKAPSSRLRLVVSH